MGKLDPRLENIFAQALGIADANERAAFVERACGGDETLRREVEELLQADQGAGDFMKAAQVVAVCPQVVARSPDLAADDSGAVCRPCPNLRQLERTG